MTYGVPLVLILLASFTQPAHDGDTWKAGASEVVNHVRQNFFDPERAEAWANEHSGYADGVRSREEFVEATRAALARLQASHTAFYSPDDPRYHGLASIFQALLTRDGVQWDSIGVDLTPDQFIRVVFAGSPADQAGLRRGDRILKADGHDFEPVRSFQGRSGQKVTLSVQHKQDGPAIEVVVTPRSVEPRQEWLDAQRAGARIIERNGKKVAYMPFYSAAGEAHEAALRDAILDQFAEADALILDFRNGWGGASPSFLNLFNPVPPRLESIGRDGQRMTFDPQWRKPLFVLINEGTTSGKEVVAHAIQKHRLGTLVGERSAGAVLAGTVYAISGDYLLYLAVADVRVDGDRLEGEGVRPDVEVADDLAYADGHDPQLERAIELAAP